MILNKSRIHNKPNIAWKPVGMGTMKLELKTLNIAKRLMEVA